MSIFPLLDGNCGRALACFRSRTHTAWEFIITPVDSIDVVLTVIGRVRARILQAAALEAAAVIGVSLLAMGVTVTLAANHITHLTALRWTAALGALGILTSALWLTLAKRWWWSRDPLHVARFVEERSGGLHNAVTTAVDLGRLPHGAEQLDGISKGLVQQVVTSSASRLRQIDPNALVDQSRAARFGLLFAFMAVVLGTVFIALPEAFSHGAHRLWHGPIQNAGDDRTRTLDVVVRDIEFRTTFPAYTHLPPRTVAGTAGDISVLPGTIVQLRARGVMPIRAGRLVLEDGLEIPVSTTEGNRIEAQLTVESPTQYRFELVGHDSIEYVERHSHAIDVTLDSDPVVALLSPEQDLEVNTQDQVHIVFEAIDDFGLSRIDVVTQKIGGGEPVRRLAQRLDAERTYRGSTLLEIADLDLEPGDAVYLWIEGVDQDTVRGPKSGRSERRVLKVWSPQEKHDELVDRLGNMVETMLILLADRLESPLEPENRTSYKAALDVAGMVNARTREMVNELDKLVEALVQDPLMPEPVRNEVRNLRDRHQELLVAEGHVLRTALLRVQMRVEQARLLWAHNNEHIAALEKDILALEDLVDRLRQEKLLNQTRDLIAQQDQLMRLLESLQAEASKEVASQAQAALDQLQAQLDAMMRELAQQAKKLPYENFNPGALDPEGTQQSISNLQEALDEIRARLAAGDIEGAMALAEQLQQQIAEMMAAMEQGFEGMSLAGGDPEMHRQLSGLDEEIGELARKESGIYRETSDIDDSLRQALEALHREKLDKLLQEEREKVAELRRALGEVNQSPLDKRDRERLDGMKDAARDLEDMLGQEDLDRAQRLSEDLEKECSGLRDELSETAKRTKSAGRAHELQEAGGQVERARLLSEEIAQDLENLMPDPSKMLTADEKKRLTRLASDQKRTRRQLDETREKLEEMESLAPGLRDVFEQLLGEAGESMDTASEKLNSDKPGQAAQHEEAALEKLGRARKRIQQMMQPRNKRMQAGPGLSTEDADIPTPEDYAVPAEFRDEVMRAMQENAPRTFRDRIERYYKELVR